MYNYALCICTFMHYAYVHLCIMHMLFVWLVCAYMCTHVYNPWTFNSRRIFFNRWTYEGIHGSSDTDTTAMEYLVQHCACVISASYHMGKHDEWKNIHVAYLCIYGPVLRLSTPPPSPPPWVGSLGTTPPFLLFASYWQHFWGPASYLLGLCSISDYQPRIY